MSLLEGNYDRSCYNYDTNVTRTNINMKSDCYLDCLIRHYGAKCFLSFAFSTSSPLREQNFPLYHDSIKNCSFQNFGNNEPVQLNCRQKCKGECYQAQYLFDKHAELPEHHHKISVLLNRHSMPDISIEYMPEMTFISLLCNIGGLVGMWCGISVLDSIKNHHHYY